MTSLLLSVGDGATSDSLDLLDTTKHFATDFSAPWSENSTRVVTVPLVFRGTTPDAVWTNYRNVQAKLRQARDAQGPYGLGTGVTLGVKLGAVTSFVYFDILDGHLDDDENRPDKGYIAATLMLVCLPYARGDATTVTTTGTIQNNDGAYATGSGTGNGGVYITGVLGDCAAPARMVLSDTSTALIINRVRWARRAVNIVGAVTGDYDHIIDGVAMGAGTATTDASTYVGANFARLSPSAGWQTFASFTKPAAYLSGEFDPVVRVRDSSAILGAAPVLASATSTSYIASYRQDTSNSGTGSSVTVVWPVPTLPGNKLQIDLKLDSRTVTITTPASWTAGPAVAHASGAVRVATFYISEAAARSGTETITLSGSASWYVTMSETVGIAYATPLDQSITNTATAAGSVALTTATLAQANEWLESIGAYDGAVNTASFSTTFAGGAGTHNPLLAVVVGYAYSTATTLHSNTHSGIASRNYAGALTSWKTQQNVAAAMPAGNYSVRVAAKSASGSIGTASNTVAVSKAAIGSIRVEWAAPAGATVDSYRIYFKRDSNAWKYFDMPATKAYLTYMLATESGATTGDPLSGSSTNVGVFRLGVALLSGTTIHWGSPFSAPLGNSLWENVPVPDRFPAPPVIAVDAGTPQSFVFYLQGKHPDEVGTLDADILALFAAPDGGDSVSGVAEYTGLELSAKKDWNIFTRKDGYTAGYLTNVGTAVEAGELDVSGEFTLMPGTNWLTLLVDITDGVSTIGSTCTYTVSVVYVPLFRYVRGA